jgi:hypothetical protein
VILSDAEIETLKKIAEQRYLPIGTAAYEILARTLKRRT